MGNLETKAQSLVVLRQSYESVKAQRMEIEKQLLDDSSYQKMLEREKELEKQYAEERGEMEAEILTAGIEERINAKDGYIDVRPAYKVSVVDGTKLEAYLKRKEGVAAIDQFVEKKWRAAKLKKYVVDAIGYGQKVTGVEAEKSVQISVNFNK